MNTAFKDFDFASFWEESDHARRDYVGSPMSEEEIHKVEEILGYKLPNAYIELIRNRNGGIPKRCCHRTCEPTSWAEDHVAITGIFGVDRSKRCSVLGEFGSEFMIDKWGYPRIGVYICDCPSAGHDMLCLDFRECGPSGEPQVVHVDQEFDYKITYVAADFGSFVTNLESDEAFDLE